MLNSTHLYGQLLGFLRQYSRARDLRHLKALAWMVSGLICSGQLSLPAWEPFVPSPTKAQSVERRWQRFLANVRIRVTTIYVPKSAGCFEWMEGTSVVLSPGHHSAVGSLLYDSLVGRVLWTSCPLVVAGVRTWQCHGGIR